MGDTIPRRLDPTAQERIGVIASRMAGGSDQGQSRFAHPVFNGPAPQPAPHTRVLEHLDDNTAARPFADVVRWRGAATPDNAADYDDWYNAD